MESEIADIQERLARLEHRAEVMHQWIAEVLSYLGGIVVGLVMSTDHSFPTWAPIAAGVAFYVYNDMRLTKRVNNL
jgi:hypothetical protein